MNKDNYHYIENNDYPEVNGKFIICLTKSGSVALCNWDGEDFYDVHDDSKFRPDYWRYVSSPEFTEAKEAQIYEIICEYLSGLYVLEPDACLENLGIDSLDMYTILQEVEKAFNIQFTDLKYSDISYKMSIRDLVHLLNAHL